MPKRCNLAGVLGVKIDIAMDPIAHSNRHPSPEGLSASVHPNIVAYKGMIAAFNANDLTAMEALVDANLVYTIPGRSPLACHTCGVTAHIQVLKLARELSAGTLRLEPRAIAADGDYLVVWGRITADRLGRRLDTDHCVMYRFAAGKIVEGRTVPVDLYAFDEFWS